MPSSIIEIPMTTRGGPNPFGDSVPNGNYRCPVEILTRKLFFNNVAFTIASGKPDEGDTSVAYRNEGHMRATYRLVDKAIPIVGASIAGTRNGIDGLGYGPTVTLDTVLKRMQGEGPAYLTGKFPASKAYKGPVFGSYSRFHYCTPDPARPGEHRYEAFIDDFHVDVRFNKVSDGPGYRRRDLWEMTTVMRFGGADPFLNQTKHVDFMERGIGAVLDRVYAVFLDEYNIARSQKRK